MGFRDKMRESAERSKEKATAKTESKREHLLADLRPVLMPGEEVLDFTTGMIHVTRMGTKTQRNGTVAVTQNRVILFTKKMAGYDMQDFQYGLISSVDHKVGAMAGNLHIAAAGDAAQITMIPKDSVERVAHKIRERLAAARQPHQAIPQTANDPLDQLKKLAELRDAGIVTPEEFEAQKKKLLG